MKLKNAVYTALFSLFVTTMLHISAEATNERRDAVEIRLLEAEVREIFRNPDNTYIFVGRQLSDLIAIVEEIGKLDENENSLLRGLVQHVDQGYSIANYDAVAQVLEEAHRLLQETAQSMDRERFAELSQRLYTIIDLVREERLNLDAESVESLRDSVKWNEEDIMRGCCPQHDCHGLRLLVVKEKVDFNGKVKFRNNVVFRDEVEFHDDVRFHDEVRFKDDVRFDDDVVFNDDVTFEDDVVFNDDVTLNDTVIFNSEVIFNSVIDIPAGSITVDGTTIACDVTVGCNLILNTSISPTVGNIIKGGARFMHNFGGNSTFLGTNAGNFTLTGIDNTGLGFNALSLLSSGAGNTAVGARALEADTTGSSNTAVGTDALADNDTGSGNTAVGFNALLVNTAGTGNTALGSGTMLLNFTGVDNTAVGRGALADNQGDENVAVGADALSNNTVGDGNTALGTGTLINFTTGDNNVAIGRDAGNVLVTGSNNIYILNGGAGAAESNAIRIGTLGVHTTATFIQGISGATTSLVAVPVLVDALGQLGTISSSITRKHNIRDMEDASEAIYGLRPVTFVYNDDASERTRYGLIAEEVAEIMPDLVARDEKGQPYTVLYQDLPIMTLNELQKLVARVMVLEDRVFELESRA